MAEGKHHKEAVERLNEMMHLLGKEGADGESFAKLCKGIVIRKNKECASSFSKVPFEKRVIFLPQCLRRVDECKAKERRSGYDCAHCGACAIAKVIQEAEKLGYRGVHVLKGGRAVIRILEEEKPQAVVGVACDYEGTLGVLECEKRKIPVQFIPLTRDGCFETDVELEEVKSVLNFREIDEP
jgi:hypothetical protein